MTTPIDELPDRLAALRHDGWHTRMSLSGKVHLVNRQATRTLCMAYERGHPWVHIAEWRRVDSSPTCRHCRDVSGPFQQRVSNFDGRAIRIPSAVGWPS